MQNGSMMSPSLDYPVAPLDDRVLILPYKPKEKSDGGIFIPDQAKERPVRGRVVAVGPGKLLDDGQRAPMTVSVGDKVVYDPYAGKEVVIGTETYKVLRESDILLRDFSS